MLCICILLEIMNSDMFYIGKNKFWYIRQMKYGRIYNCLYFYNEEFRSVNDFNFSTENFFVYWIYLNSDICNKSIFIKKTKYLCNMYLCSE